jgi:hypothetical protein
MGKKNKKEHSEEVYNTHEGFREGVVKYSYNIEHQGKIITEETDEEKDYKIGQIVNKKKIRNIQIFWSYGTCNFLIHLE